MQPLKTAEDKLREKLEGDGWTITHKGWPDFACIRDGQMMFVEVKNYKGEMLKKQQHFMLTHLARLGLNCFKWTPDGGFEKITPTTPMPVIKKHKRAVGRRLTREEKWAKLSPETQEQINKALAEGRVVYW